jgi:hypothetical protein
MLATGSMGGGGGRRENGVGPRARRPRPNAWRGPLGALALAVAATGYWSTVAWLVASRTEPVLIEEPVELDLPQLAEPDGVVPRQHDRFEDRFGDHRVPRINRVPGYRMFSLQPRELGLAWGTPPMVLVDEPLDRHR